MSRTRLVLSRLLPAVVSLLVLGVVFSRLDLATVWHHMKGADLSLWLPFLVLYGVGCVACDGIAVRVAIPAERRPSLWQAARLRAATYPLGLLHYAFGSLGTIALLRRRVGLGVMEATGLVGLMAMIDLGLVLVFAGVGAAFFATRPPPVDRAVFVGFLGLAITGFLVLRFAPAGPLRTLAERDVFRTLREIPLSSLAGLHFARLGILCLFLTLGGVTFAAFGAHVPTADLVVNLGATALVAALPIALSGLGTTQAAMVYLFSHWADPEVVLAVSLTLSAGIIVSRVGLGLLFAGEYTRAAYEDVHRQEEAA